jgi:formamidopyrimidine-DNA glycosylase
MPEAPEVERIVKKLRPMLVGGTITKFQSYHKCFRDVPTGVLILKVKRHGKWIVLVGADEHVTMINLGMSGNFAVGAPLRNHARWAARVEHGEDRIFLQFVDPRCMGRLKWLNIDESRLISSSFASVQGCPSIGLGPDVLNNKLAGKDETYKRARWKALLNVPFGLKRALMAQHIVAGLGNIYSSEACWRARALPSRPANSLSTRQLTLLSAEVPKMLLDSLRLGGTSLGDANSFRGINGGREGKGGAILRVYARAGLPCKRCGETVVKGKDQGRSTFWCPGCQE